MGIVINQATWGDETATTDITTSMQEKAKPGYLDLIADTTLVPALDLLSGSKNVTISDSEKADIKKLATELCGSASDNKCIQFQSNQLESTTLQKKVAEQQSSANIVTGRRLTLTYTDDQTGQKRTVAIPDGQKVKFGTPPAVKMPDFTPSSTILGFLGTFSKIAMTLLYVFSIGATYRLLILTGQTMLAYVLTAISIVIPYSGLLMTPIALGILKYMEIKASVPKVVPGVV
jgi:hypothetical protein